MMQSRRANFPFTVLGCSVWISSKKWCRKVCNSMVTGVFALGSGSALIGKSYYIAWEIAGIVYRF
jgi:hypothetical protein